MKKYLMLGLTAVFSIAVFAGGTPGFVKFPENYKDTFANYHSQNRANNKQVAELYANSIAVESAREKGELADGSVLVMEVYKPRKDSEGKPVTGENGLFEKAGLAAVAVMEKRSNWDSAFPSEDRAGDWGFAIYDAGGQPKENDLNCVSCHTTLSGQDHLFTFQKLSSDN